MVGASDGDVFSIGTVVLLNINVMRSTATMAEIDSTHSRGEHLVNVCIKCNTLVFAGIGHKVVPVCEALEGVVQQNDASSKLVRMSHPDKK